jgi:hypothetical protein
MFTAFCMYPREFLSFIYASNIPVFTSRAAVDSHSADQEILHFCGPQRLVTLSARDREGPYPKTDVSHSFQSHLDFLDLPNNIVPCWRYSLGITDSAT